MRRVRPIRLVIIDRSPLTAGRDDSVNAHRTWRPADLASKHMLPKAGFGWGMMPWWTWPTTSRPAA